MSNTINVVFHKNCNRFIPIHCQKHYMQWNPFSHDPLGTRKSNLCPHFRGSNSIIFLKVLFLRLSCQEGFHCAPVIVEAHSYVYTCHTVPHHCSFSLQNASPGTAIVLVGNRGYEEEWREVSQEEGKELAASMKVPFFEVSCKTRENIDEV